MKAVTAIATTGLVATILLGLGACRPPANPAVNPAARWTAVKAEIRERFPAARPLAVTALHAWLADTNRPPPLLLDCRAEEEFAVSHLVGAVRFAGGKDLSAVTNSVRPVVVYCSVGYRSAGVAERLQESGVREVYNLEGSIFEWANRDYPLFRGTNRATVVHPYDAAWGRLLEARFHPVE